MNLDVTEAQYKSEWLESWDTDIGVWKNKLNNKINKNPVWFMSPARLHFITERKGGEKKPDVRLS